MTLYPAIDLMDGHCVRLAQGNFNEVTSYSDDPIKVATSVAEAGIHHLHVVDLDGAKAGSARQFELIRNLVRAVPLLKVQTGGGVRSVEEVASLLEAGVDRAVVGSVAVKSPAVLKECLARFGPERITLAADVADAQSENPRVVTHGWKNTESLTLWDLLSQYAPLGLVHLLCTDTAKDGMLEGPTISLYREIHKRFPRLRVQASGGISCLEDVRRLKAEGVAGVVFGKAWYEGRFTLQEALSC